MLPSALQVHACVAAVMYLNMQHGFCAPQSSLLLTVDCPCPVQVLSQDIDLLHPPVELEKAKNKRKRLVQSPNSFFMDVKCQGCFQM